MWPIWVDNNGNKVSCVEKIKVMQQNIVELQQLAQDTFEDGVLMEINPDQLRSFLADLMLNLTHNYKI
jgi:hypothetical protein